MNSHPLQNFSDSAGNFIIWVVLGLGFLWVITTMAETVMARVRPVLMFIIIAAVVGAIIANVVTKAWG